MALDPAFTVVEVDVLVEPELAVVVVPELPDAEGVPELFELHAARLNPVNAIIAASATSRRPRGAPEKADPERSDPERSDPEKSDIGNPPCIGSPLRALRIGRPPGASARRERTSKNYTEIHRHPDVGN
jgi:hypothetical protein